MGLIAAINVGAPGDQPDVDKINAAFEAIRAVVNGDIDASNVENASIVLAKLAGTIRFAGCITFKLHNVLMGLPAFNGFATNNLSGCYAEAAMTIFRVSCKACSTVGASGKAKLYINGVAQAASELAAALGAAGNRSAVLNIAVAAGDTLDVRYDGLTDLQHLPVEYVVWFKAPLQ